MRLQLHRLFTGVEWIYHALFLLLPLTVSFNNDELFEFPKVLVVYIATVAIVAIWALHSIAEKKLVYKRTPFDLPIGVFLASQLLSTLLSMHPYTSIFGYYSRFNGGLLSVVSYAFLYYGWILYIDTSAGKRLIKSLLIGGVIASLYALPEHVGVSPSCVLLTGEFNVDCWVQDVQTRIFGTFGQPNWLAAYLVVLLPLTVAYAIRQTHRFMWKQVVWPTSFVLFCLVLLYTQSRSGIVGAGIALGTFLTFTLLHTYLFNPSITNLPSALRHKIVPYTLGAVVLFSVLTLVIPNPVRNRILTLLSIRTSAPTAVVPTTGTQLETGGSESGDIRKVVWKGSIDVWKRYPVFGSGVETFAYSYFTDRPVEHNALSEWDFLYNKAHNEFLNFLATTGIVGLFSYIALIASFIVLPLRWAFARGKKEEFSPYVWIGTSASLIGLSISNFFGFSTVVVSFLTFILPALSWTLRVPTTRPDGKVRLTFLQIGGVGIVVFLFLLSFRYVYTIWRADSAFAQAKQAARDDDLEQALAHISNATKLRPREALYYDELSYTLAKAAVYLEANGESTAAAEFAQFAISSSDQTIALNPVHVNFYKTRSRVFTLLSQFQPSLLEEAIKSIEVARTLSPTDPKLPYFIAVIEGERGNTQRQQQLLEETIALRPTDEAARMDLAKIHEEKKEWDKAKEHYSYVLQFINPENPQAKERIASISAMMK